MVKYYCFRFGLKEWLQQGSRELFGTIIEDQVCTGLPVPDTCSPVVTSLLVKKKKFPRRNGQLVTLQNVLDRES